MLNTNATEAAYNENLKIIQEYSHWGFYRMNEASKALGVEFRQSDIDWSEMKEFAKTMRKFSPDEDIDPFWARQQSLLVMTMENFKDLEKVTDELGALKQGKGEMEASQEASGQRLPAQN